ncbi:hypothetical protein [Actibacterium sp. 188UL27-1]|uniref:hypothetical protein n=1 Tax=Actibacterium sp. 188UL27-1 TaxID=2786961 RepID=UPI00195949F8|nr:hypothetical protein [Actibacterium sp. 188UL27-1]MBM7067003.1 hypothetical protein [Actibacterium sp. 188UL27-1]
MHNGKQSNSYNDLIATGKDGSLRYLDLLGNELQGELDKLPESDLEACAKEAHDYGVKAQNFQNFQNFVSIHSLGQENLDKQFGKDTLKSIPLNSADPNFKVSVIPEENKAKVQDYHKSLGNYFGGQFDDKRKVVPVFADNPVFKEIETQRGPAFDANGEPRIVSDISGQLVEKYPKLGYIYYPNGEVKWTDDMRAESVAKGYVLKGLRYNTSNVYQLMIG